MKRITVALAALPAALLTVVLLPASPASAHPLGNFSVNEYVGVTLHPDRVEAEAIVDLAEIPTLQDLATVDTDGNGTPSEAERVAHATVVCAHVARAVAVQANGNRLTWTVTSSQFGYSAGAGGLNVSRLDCLLSSPAPIGDSAQVSIDNGYLADRVGWRELTATGEGVRLVDSPVPAVSASNKLRDYPQDLLASALDVRTASLRVTAGEGSDGSSIALTTGTDPVSRWLAGVDRAFQDVAGGELTPWVGVLAVLLAIVLGAGHAALPGHGKTILAAYLAGKRGRPRDALTIAGTVTLTHTGGVLVLGLVLTAGSQLAGERILGWLGLVSGVVVIGVGATMLLAILRRRRVGHTHSHDDHSHSHDHSHDHDHGHSHSHSHGRTGRWSLAGMGIAGGLVPSPSALIVLLAAIGLGRTAFGVLLVVAYGAGMALTLTGAGLLLLAVQRRMARAARPGRILPRLGPIVARVNAATPAATAALVLLVGTGLALRAAATVL